MEKYENYIWDFDGTLFDSYKRMSLAFWKAMQRYAGRQEASIPVSREEVRKKMKISVGFAWEWYRKEYQLPDSVINEYRELERSMTEEPIRPFPEAQAVLKALNQAGARQFVYTHRGAETWDYLQQYDLSQYFIRCITREDGFPPKPAPDALLSLIHEYRLKPEQCLMIGDRRIDILAAQNAGISGCFVNSEPSIPETGYPYHIQNLNELIVE